MAALISALAPTAISLLSSGVKGLINLFTKKKKKGSGLTGGSLSGSDILEFDNMVQNMINDVGSIADLRDFITKVKEPEDAKQVYKVLKSYLNDATLDDMNKAALLRIQELLGNKLKELITLETEGTLPGDMTKLNEYELKKAEGKIKLDDMHNKLEHDIDTRIPDQVSTFSNYTFDLRQSHASKAKNLKKVSELSKKRNTV